MSSTSSSKTPFKPWFHTSLCSIRSISLVSLISLFMKYKHMSLHVSKVDDDFLNEFCLKYHIAPEYKPTAPLPHHRITDCPDGYIGVYTKHFDFSNLRIPFSNFFLDFLKDYRLHICQLSPLGAIRVSHFEIACRALGGKPSLPLFRQFFMLAHYGDWYTVEKRKKAPSCAYKVPWSYKRWRSYFFWVSAEVIPFKMHWREPSEPMCGFHSPTERFDMILYRKLVDHPMPLQPFHEHVLILTGLSRKWPYVDAEPILKDGDDEIGLVNYLQKKGPGAVKHTRRLLVEHEDNILDRTRGVCYEGPVNTGVGDAPKHTMGDSSERVRMLDDLLLDPETELDALVFPEWVLASSSKRRKVVPISHIRDMASKRSPKRRRKKIVLSESDEESSDQTTLDASKSDRVGREKKTKKEIRLRDRISRYRVTMSRQHVQNAKLAKKLKQASEEVELHREMVEKLNREHELLEKSLKRVLSERQWLIKEGFEYVIDKLHKSEEYLKPLGVVLSKIWSSGAHDGVIEGYACCKAGVALEDVGVYKPKADEELRKAVDELEQLRFPYMVALSQCAEDTLDDLKALEPIGLEDDGDEVVAGGDHTNGK